MTVDSNPGGAPISQSSRAGNGLEQTSASTSNITNNTESKDETLHTQESTSELNAFFDSYVSDVNQPGGTGAESVCSDSVSRYDGKRGNGVQQVADCVVQMRSGNGLGQIRQPTRSGTSSLATLVSERKISDSRRTFCLFVTFDLLLTTLLWLIMCGTSSGGKDGFLDIVSNQIKEYELDTSMFDVVCLAAGRFAFLELMYALLWIKHWWPVAVSTSVSDILLILKIFPIFINAGSSEELTKAIPMTIVLLLTNFILTWIEVWFIDFKVLPEEARSAQRTARQFIQSQGQQNRGYGFDEADETSPLIRSFRPPPSTFYTVPPSDRLSYHTVLESDYGTAIGNELRGNVFPIPISSEDAVYVEKGKAALNQLWSAYKNRGIWTLERELENGDTLYTTNLPDYGKTFRIDAIVRGVSTPVIFQEILLKGEVMPTWNSSVSDVKILKRIGQQTAISVEVSAPAGKGLIQSRDFVTVRRIDKIDNHYISAGISTDYDIPPSDRIRGINGPTGFIISPCEGEFAATNFTWILNTNLKGSLPRYLVNSNLLSTMITFVKCMKIHLGVDE